MKAQTRWLVIVSAGILAGLFLLFGVLLLFTLFSCGSRTGSFPSFLRRFESNGQRIYFTGTSKSGEPITAEMPGIQTMPGMHRMTQGMMVCAECHGSDGRGGTVRMMGTFTAPDIRYKTLTSEEEHGQAHEGHPPFTDETLKRAITEGIDPAGEPLAWPMPRWDMSERDLNDLIEFLKTLE